MQAIDKSKPWYWICVGEKKGCTFFNCTEAERNPFIAAAIVVIRNRKKERDMVWYLMKRYEHPSRDYKQYKCPKCDNLMSDNELGATWDWSGPHCDRCGCAGMEMFSAVQDHAPVMSCREKILNELNKLKEGK